MPVSDADAAARYCADLVAGMADAGVDIVFLSPGSRNTPLTLAFVAEPRIGDIAIRDERSAGFAAVGYGKATGRPAAVVCTSGSAATHYFPAIVEADQASIPLIVLTADRPARLRGTGAPQTMDQLEIYGNHVKLFKDLDVSADTGRGDGLDLAQASLSQPCGAVHANASFEDRLLPDTPVPASHAAPATPDITSSGTQSYPLDDLTGARVLIVAGGGQGEGFNAAVNKNAALLAAPVMADPQCWVTGPNTIAHADLLAGTPGVLDTSPPDVVLRLGPLPTSKPLWTWLEHSGIEQILINRSRLSDPLGSAATVVEADPTQLLTDHASSHGGSPGSDFLESWLALDKVAGKAAHEAMLYLPFQSEPRIAAELVAVLTPGSLLYLASSMPIRDVDTFASPRSDITVLGNRGVSGIDGTISSALGAALSGVAVTLLIGDVAALHDATAMSQVAQSGAPLRIIVINNDGGGIFSFLPQADASLVDSETYERYWGTPHGLSLARVADSLGLPATRIDTLDDYVDRVSTPIDAPHLIELHTNRRENVRHHHAVREAVRHAITAHSERAS